MFSKHRIEFLLLIFVGRIFTCFGFNHIKTTSQFIAFLIFSILRIRRKIVIKNLQTAFPTLNFNEIKKIAYKNYVSIAITFLEIFYVNKIDKDTVINSLTIHNPELLNRKIAEKKGLIFLTAHFGNWELGAISTGLHVNQTIRVLAKKQKNPYVSEWMTSIREKFGNKEIFLGVSVRELYSAIKDKQMVGVVGDQRGTRDGVVVNFFGKPTYTFPGTASIILKTNCSVIVFLCFRNKNGKYESISEEINVEELTGSKDEKIKEFNQRYMLILENVIRKYPEQWFWMHNIWKY